MDMVVDSKIKQKQGLRFYNKIPYKLDYHQEILKIHFSLSFLNK